MTDKYDIPADWKSNYPPSDIEKITNCSVGDGAKQLGKMLESTPVDQQAYSKMFDECVRSRAALAITNSPELKKMETDAKRNDYEIDLLRKSEIDQANRRKQLELSRSIYNAELVQLAREVQASKQPGVGCDMSFSESRIDYLGPQCSITHDIARTDRPQTRAKR